MDIKSDTIFIKIVGSSVVALVVPSNFGEYCETSASEFASIICFTDELHSEINVPCLACTTHRYKTISLKTLSTMMQNHDQETISLTYVPLLMKTVQHLKHGLVEFWTCGMTYLQIGILSVSFSN